MFRSFLLLLLAIASVAHAYAQHDALDPAFPRIPFDRWLTEPNKASFRWTAGVPRAELSFHQRLQSQVKIKLDGRDLQNRRHGQLVFFVQVTASDGARYQDHGAIELSKLDENIRSADLEYSQPAFFLPGDYGFAVALLDTATGEHSAREGKFRVASPRQNFLAEAWRALPSVEFIGKESGADADFLPGVHGRLVWAASVNAPVRLHILLTEAPSLPARATPADQSALIATLKVLSQTGSALLSEEIELLDLARQRALFHQSDAHDLAWPALKTSLSQANTSSIDVHSLSDRHHGAQFFVSEVRKLLRPSETPCVLIVLSKSIAFESGEDMNPISTEGLSACRVVYIRYRPTTLVPSSDREMDHRRRGPRLGGPMARNLPSPEIDELEPSLKPLNPKVFDVQTPEQMTKALAEVKKLLVSSGGHS